MFNDPSINTAISAILEKSINKALHYDPATALKLRQMDEFNLKVACESPNIDIYFQTQDAPISKPEDSVTNISETHIRVLSYTETEADIVVTGKASDFFSMMNSSKHSLSDSNISVSGKINLLNQLKSILSDLDLDWEDALTDILGVIPGHALAEGIRSSWRFLSQQGNSLKANLPLYLSEELKVIPSRTELEIFYREVDDLRSASTRLEARIERIKKKQKTQNNHI